MSHLVTVPVQVHHREGIDRACTRLGLSPVTEGTKQFYDGQVKTGTLVQLQDWMYPLVIDTKSGEVHCDNYGGTWGKQESLDTFLQAYAVETAKMTAEAQGYSVTEELLADGSVHLNVLVQH